MRLARSLSGRLVIASLLVLPLFLGLAGYLLQLAFASSLQTSAEAQLKTRLYGLLGIAEWQDQQLNMPQRLADPDLNNPTSGLYAAISRGPELLWQSPSSQLLDSSKLSRDEQPFAAGHHSFSVGPLLRYRLDVVWESEEGDQPLSFVVFQSDQEMVQALAAYRHQLAVALAILGLFLLLAQVLVLRFGLRPLRTMSRELRRLESGEQQQLDGDYPRELARLANNLNRVIASQQQQQQRYRNALGDLAHSLKTPLAVMRTGVDQTTSQAELAELVIPQLSRMEQIVGHQLNRAVLAASNSQQQQVRLAPVIERLAAALTKVYRGKGVQLTTELAPDLAVNGDEADLLELFGNLLENGFKYATSQVAVTISHSDGVIIVIDDDGPGIAPEQRATILKRGERADTVLPGQGLGLAIASDILSSYRGELRIDSSPLGGARFWVRLPG